MLTWLVNKFGDQGAFGILDSNALEDLWKILETTHGVDVISLANINSILEHRKALLICVGVLVGVLYLFGL